MFLGIPRSANNPGSRTKSEKSDQSIPEGPAIFEGERTCCFLRVDGVVWTDLAVFSVSNFSSSFILKISREIVRINFSCYIFFCFRRRMTRFSFFF